MIKRTKGFFIFVWRSIPQKFRNELLFFKVEVSINSLHDELDRGMVDKENLAEDGSYHTDKEL